MGLYVEIHIENWMNCWKPKSKDKAISSEAIDHSIERSETTGGKMDFLNNQISVRHLTL
jgi:hypothetical protein